MPGDGADVYLLDTNALSEPVRKRPSPAFLKRLATAKAQPLYSSVVCLMELRHGCARHPHGARLWERLQRDVLPLLVFLAMDEPVAVRAGELMASLLASGRPHSTEDVVIASTAMIHRLVLVTHNTVDFQDIKGLQVQDWM